MENKILIKIMKVAMGATLALTSTMALSLPITVSSGTSSATLMEDFGGLNSSSTSFYDGNGVNVAETFAGLTVVDPGVSGFESYSGLPTSPLSLYAGGAASTGVASIIFGTDFDFVFGLAGGTTIDDIGEGVVALLFYYDIIELGLTIVGNNGGST
ncbi:MAG: hypothetical protein ACI9SC_001436 [Gammaproteobacteria bacterium]|jgi:hypothetical protein